MRQSQLFTRTERRPPADEVSLNARLLQQAGFIDKVAAGIYSYLPLGLNVLRKIQGIVREEMLALGAQEVLLPALHPKEPWAATGRWRDPGPAVMYQFTGHGEQDFGLGWTHEEIVTPLVARHVRSYRDLPLAVFQIQDKFRNEPRAKSGLLRGREFSMKDLYSFHRDRADLERYYERVSAAYQKIFTRCGLVAVVTEASGGPFAPFSHEFQVVTPYGEDVIVRCPACQVAQNRELCRDGATPCPRCGHARQEEKAIEVGNIFQLGTRFSDAFALRYVDEAGALQPAVMGCYGIGPSRVMGAIVEIHHDDKGLRWPFAVAPFAVHLLALGAAAAVKRQAAAVYAELQSADVSVLFDDRLEPSAGEKFHDADLLGLPYRVVVSAKTGAKVEVKPRDQKSADVTTVAALVARCAAAVKALSPPRPAAP